MASFLEQQYSKSIECLTGWRARYPKDMLCEKIVLNTFYRQQSMLNAFKKMNDGFEKKAVYQTISDAYTMVYIDYSKESEKLAAIDLQSVLDTTNDNLALGIKYSDFKAISQGSKGSNSLNFQDAYEKIATGYIVNFIANNQVMLWAALGYLGKTRTIAIQEVMGIGIENIDTMGLPYVNVYSIAEQYGALPFVKEINDNKFSKDIGLYNI